jgi:hypothetical protein
MWIGINSILFKFFKWGKIYKSWFKGFRWLKSILEIGWNKRLVECNIYLKSKWSICVGFKFLLVQLGDLIELDLSESEIWELLILHKLEFIRIHWL